jgi:hypothetical protein
VRYPQLVVYEPDGWIAKQLRELAGESRWLLREARQLAVCRTALRQPRPTVLVLHVELDRGRAEALQLLADVSARQSDVAAVVVSDVKMDADERATFTALAFDLGARYVLFPPLHRPILEDLVSGLMAAAVRRTTSASPAAEAEPDGPLDLAQLGGDDV